MKVTVITFLLLLAGTVLGSTYVSFNGGFRIEYPENWLQVDYNTADLFLRRSATDPSTLHYEAVFAPKSSSPFFATEYLILTLDTYEWLYDYQIDSIVEDFNKNFGEGIKYSHDWEYLADIQTNQPVYDEENRILTMANDIVQGDVLIKKNLLVKKFHDKGVANFFFYATDSLFEQSKSTFREIVMSFSTESIDQSLPKEDVKVAEIDRENKNDTRNMIIVAIIGLLIIIILVLRTQRSARKKEQG